MQDRVTVHIVVASLALIGIIGLGCVTALQWKGTDPAGVAVIVALIGPAIGGLTAILATTRTGPADPPTAPPPPEASVPGA